MTDSGARLILWTVAAALTGALLAIPQPVDPWEMPSLVLDRRAVAESVRESRALAATIPQGPEVERLRELFLGHGASEVDDTATRVDWESE